MSRIIKFRAWHKNNKYMCQNVTTDLLDRDYLEFMQYTGLKDKNGKEIYEGDILCVSGYSYEEPEDDWIGEVTMGSLGWGVYGFNSSGDKAFYYLTEIGGSYKTIYEIQGNICENPELLNQ